MIVSGGENIFPNDIEECLLRHPGVDEAAVIGVARRLDGEKIVVAYIVPTEMHRPSRRASRFLRRPMPAT